MLRHWITWFRTVFREWWQFGNLSSSALQTASVLDRAVAFDAAEPVYRVALKADKAHRLQRLREEIGDVPELAEAMQFLDDPSILHAADLADLLRLPFNRPPSPSRFTNGSYGVLYTAREQETAAQEYAYWAPRYFCPAPGTTYRIRLHLISCLFEGRAKDVHQFLDEYPWLIFDDYRQCQELGGAARAEGLAGLIAPSARRRPDGITVPVFMANAASRPAEEGEVRFTVSAIDPTTFDIIPRGTIVG
jgi:RES domain